MEFEYVDLIDDTRLENCSLQEIDGGAFGLPGIYIVATYTNAQGNNNQLIINPDYILKMKHKSLSVVN
ncbi:hypothetical protein TP70_02180 [Staphylococcus microti]|uniref:Uncharacterized protein n=1 Tax=Staphylococcus microti TaxID=569857 RepID=A0A0D6XTA3_9STAP|nr:hypothetical protein [Staphylococcus microti]KIX91441.1 hypothetical protein TP70_02180 [Staphylococcus microti]PNZ82494.1 hypothetical protein CD132_04140 [Staphylococcus microti]PNZ83679.1 hypothetical protein CD132_02010 [Staphylococcus microti]SUM57015.1 Uncharacterised protein [Staphylococcus microti]